jgi:dethiobiotin synthetase
MNRRLDFFITGTDTGVGKTMVTAALLAALRSRGTDAVAMKPVQTGAVRGRSPDLDFCAKVSGWKIRRDEFDDLCPYRFPMPASPHLAARVAGRNIRPRNIIAAFRRLQQKHESVLVEGAGGLLVPLTTGFDQRDLIAELGLPVVVVCRAGLGTLNHTLLTAEALDRNGIAIAAFVLSDTGPDRSRILDNNLNFLRKKLFPNPVLSLPRVGRGRFPDAGSALLDAITRATD